MSKPITMPDGSPLTTDSAVAVLAAVNDCYKVRSGQSSKPKVAKDVGVAIQLANLYWELERMPEPDMIALVEESMRICREAIGV